MVGRAFYCTLYFIIFCSIFFVGASMTKVHQLPNGRIADTFDNFPGLDFLNRCCSFKAQVSTVKTDKLGKRAKRLW